MLFSDPEAFAKSEKTSASVIENLREICRQFPTPEHIDDDPSTAPSKRILKLFPNYQKPTAGILIAKAIGLERLRVECKHFDEWLKRLESLKPIGCS